MVYSSGVWAQQSTQQIIDSLEGYSHKIKPGWDELDYRIGMFRQYLFSNMVEKADLQYNRVIQIADEENIPEAEVYGLILENIRAYVVEGDNDKAIQKCKEAIELAREIGHSETLAYARYQLAENYYFEKGDPQKAIDQILLSIPEMDENVTLKTLGNTYKTLGHVYGQIGKYEEGLKYLEQALTYFNELVNSPPVDPRIGRLSTQDVQAEMHVTNTLNYMGDLYVMQGKISQALEVKLQGLQLMKKLHNKDMMAWMYHQTGKLYAETGRLNEAVSDFQKSRMLFEELGLQKDIHHVNETMIPTLVRMGELELASSLIEDNITYYKENNDTLFLASSYVHGSGIFLMYEDQVDLIRSNKYLKAAAPLISKITDPKIESLNARMNGLYAKRKNELDKAESLLKQALAISSSSNKLFQARVIYDLGDNFLLKKEYDSAMTYAQKAIEFAVELNDRDLSMDGYQLLSRVGAASKNYQLAYESHTKFFQLYDSLYTINAQAKLKEEQVRQGIFNYQQDKELAEQNARILADQNQMYLFAGAILVVLLCLMIYLYVSLRRVKAKTQSQNIQLTQLNQTKDKFFGIIAHDLKSPLIGLQGVGEQVDYYLKKRDSDRLQQVTENISDTTKRLNELLDNLLNWALLQNGMIPYHPGKVNIGEVSDAVLRLLQPIADQKGIQLINEVHKGCLVYADKKAVDTIIRNLVSNALKYTEENGTVSIRVQDEDDRLNILINDTGTGISAEQVPEIFNLKKESKVGTRGEKGSGLGLVLCKELVELNKGSIKVESTVGLGSTFSFDLPKAA